MPDRILYLDASEGVLRCHKENDKIRLRNFFEYHLKYLIPLKKELFFGKKIVDILNVDNLTEDRVGEEVKSWIDKCINEYKVKETQC